MRGRANARWPAAIADARRRWYAATRCATAASSGHGYALHGEGLDVGAPEFLRAAEALTSAPISTGNDVELLINGDKIFPAFLETIAGAQRRRQPPDLRYWRGRHRARGRGALCARAKAGVEVNVVLDAIGHDADAGATCSRR